MSTEQRHRDDNGHPKVATEVKQRRLHLSNVSPRTVQLLGHVFPHRAVVGRLPTARADGHLAGRDTGEDSHRRCLLLLHAYASASAASASGHMLNPSFAASADAVSTTASCTELASSATAR